MAIVLAIGAWLGWLVHGARVQSSAVNVLQKSGGKVWYSWQPNSIDDFSPDPQERPSWPRWIVDRLGDDFFGRVVKVELGGEEVSDRELISVGDLDRLKFLAVGGAKRITGAGYRQLGRLTELRVLALRSNSITDDGLSSVAALERLEELDLSSCERITDDGLTRLTGLRNLRVLALERTAVTDRGMGSVACLASLQELYITYDSVGDAGMAQLANLNSLKCLGAHGCAAVSDAGIAHLTRARALARLNLSGTRVSDAGMQWLKQLKNLRELDVSNSDVTERGAADLRSTLPNLEIYNPPSGGDPFPR
jgi:hypothetical protein